jgi:hypothetical protein
LLPAKLNLAQPAGSVFGHQLLSFRATPASPNLYHLCLFMHPSTASRTAALGQRGGFKLPEAASVKSRGGERFG